VSGAVEDGEERQLKAVRALHADVAMMPGSFDQPAQLFGAGRREPVGGSSGIGDLERQSYPLGKRSSDLDQIRVGGSVGGEQLDRRLARRKNRPARFPSPHDWDTGRPRAWCQNAMALS
jgi:hypothetical protein